MPMRGDPRAVAAPLSGVETRATLTLSVQLVLLPGVLPSVGSRPSTDALNRWHCLGNGWPAHPAGAVGLSTPPGGPP